MVQSSATRIDANVSVQVSDLGWTGRFYAVLFPAQDDQAKLWQALAFNFSIADAVIRVVGAEPSAVPSATAAAVRFMLSGLRDPPAASGVVVTVRGVLAPLAAVPAFNTAGLLVLAVIVPSLPPGPAWARVDVVEAEQQVSQPNLNGTGVLLVDAPDISLGCIAGCNYTVGSAEQQVLHPAMIISAAQPERPQLDGRAD